MHKTDSPLFRQHQQFMGQAFRLAEQALDEGEIPIGAVVVHNQRIIGKGYNQVQRLNDPTAHAEIIAITAACEHLNNKYLTNCTLYVTIEPCPMCAGALVWSKIDTVVFGAPDGIAGACGSAFNISTNKKLNHQVEVIQGVMEQDCSFLLKAFFEQKRNSG